MSSVHIKGSLWSASKITYQLPTRPTRSPALLHCTAVDSSSVRPSGFVPSADIKVSSTGRAILTTPGSCENKFGWRLHQEKPHVSVVRNKIPMRRFKERKGEGEKDRLGRKHWVSIVVAGSDIWFHVELLKACFQSPGQDNKFSD